MYLLQMNRLKVFRGFLVFLNCTMKIKTHVFIFNIHGFNSLNNVCDNRIIFGTLEIKYCFIRPCYTFLEEL